VANRHRTTTKEPMMLTDPSKLERSKHQDPFLEEDSAVDNRQKTMKRTMNDQRKVLAEILTTKERSFIERTVKLLEHGAKRGDQKRTLGTRN
jgi:DNA-directed RNA polymerase sigma subunit (sigma70/sigma32)